VGEGKVEALTIPKSLHQALLVEARRGLPNECCGLLGGQGRRVVRLFPATNELASPTAYEIPVRELFSIFRRLRAEELELVGIYHSHPSGDNVPSATDCRRAYYPEAAHVILSPQPAASQPVRAFLIREGKAEEITVEVVD
jgi:proteasome lid subunit RPN8/RPN11